MVKTVEEQVPYFSELERKNQQLQQELAARQRSLKSVGVTSVKLR